MVSLVSSILCFLLEYRKATELCILIFSSTTLLNVSKSFREEPYIEPEHLQIRILCCLSFPFASLYSLLLLVPAPAKMPNTTLSKSKLKPSSCFLVEMIWAFFFYLNIVLDVDLDIDLPYAGLIHSGLFPFLSFFSPFNYRWLMDFFSTAFSTTIE